MDYREAEELCWYPSWSNSLWQGWSCGLVHCPGRNSTDPIWRMLASSDGISSWTPLKPQHSNPNPNPFANQLWCIDFITPPTPLEQNFIVYRSSKVSNCIFEIHQLWQSGFCRVYSNCCCSCSFEPEIIKIGQSSHNMNSNNILKFQEPTTILNPCTKEVLKLIKGTTYQHCCFSTRIALVLNNPRRLICH